MRNLSRTLKAKELWICMLPNWHGEVCKPKHPHQIYHTRQHSTTITAKTPGHKAHPVSGADLQFLRPSAWHQFPLWIPWLGPCDPREMSLRFVIAAQSCCSFLPTGRRMARLSRHRAQRSCVDSLTARITQWFMRPWRQEVHESKNSPQRRWIFKMSQISGHLSGKFVENRKTAGNCLIRQLAALVQ